MIRVEHSVLIARPVEEVFAYVTRAESVPEWKRGLEAVRRETTGPPGVGTRETHVSEFLGALRARLSKRQLVADMDRLKAMMEAGQ